MEKKDLIENCLREIENKMGWGHGSQWTNSDFQRLSEVIHRETGILLSISTLKRIWGRVKYEGSPTQSTLDTLTSFLGFENWRSFTITQKRLTESAEQNAVRNLKKDKLVNRKVLTGLCLFGITLITVVISLHFIRAQKTGTAAKPGFDDKHFSFSSAPVTEGIPNSVIFKYDATEAPVDSVWIQQSWDPKRREKVPRDSHVHTSIYYEPGFYKAKLLVGDQVVKEHSLIIPSNGWKATVKQGPDPMTYLDSTAFLSDAQIGCSREFLDNMKPAAHALLPTVSYYNVGSFEPFNISDFSFRAQIRNNYPSGNNACRFSTVLLVTDNTPIVIPLSVKGCIAELTLMGADHIVSGKNADLSAFGVDFNGWSTVTCRSSRGKLIFEIDGKEGYVLELADYKANVLGMVFQFKGSGYVKNIQLSKGVDLAFTAF